MHPKELLLTFLEGQPAENCSICLPSILSPCGTAGLGKNQNLKCGLCFIFSPSQTTMTITAILGIRDHISFSHEVPFRIFTLTNRLSYSLSSKILHAHFLGKKKNRFLDKSFQSSLRNKWSSWEACSPIRSRYASNLKWIGFCYKLGVVALNPSIQEEEAGKWISVSTRQTWST